MLVMIIWDLTTTQSVDFPILAETIRSKDVNSKMNLDVELDKVHAQL